MPEIERYVVSITTRDGVKRPSVTSYYVSKADAEEYLSAADATARLATAVGVLLTRFLIMTECVFDKIQVGLEVANDIVVYPAASVYRGNKLSLAVRSGGRGLTSTIPGRDPTSYTQVGTTLEVSLTTPTAMTNFISQYNAHVLDAFENPSVITDIKIVD